VEAGKKKFIIRYIKTMFKFEEVVSGGAAFFFLRILVIDAKVL